MNPDVTTSEQPLPPKPRPTVIVVAAMLEGLLLAAGAVAFSQKMIGPAAFVAIVAAGTFIVVPAVIVFIRRQKRYREATLAHVGRELGVTLVVKPTRQQKEAAFAAVAHLGKTLAGGAKNVRMIAEPMEVGGRAIELIHHSYVISTGQASRTIDHIVASTPCPVEWPELSLSPENLLHKIGELLGAKDFKLDRDGFNRRWRVRTDDEDFAVLALTPSVQEWLEQAPKHESWRIGGGRVCCLHTRPATHEWLPHPPRRLAEFVSLLPPELDAWRGMSEAPGAVGGG